MTTFINAVISLFKAVPFINSDVVAVDDAALMAHGVFVSPEAKEALPCVGEFADVIVKEHGYDLEKVNNTLHKSFGKVKNAPMMQLFVEQMLHYCSVYVQNGGDSTAADEVDSSLVYIPAEALEVPVGNPVRVTVIRALTDAEIISRTKSMLSGMALSEQTMDALMEVVKHYGVLAFSLDEVKNKEFKVRMMDELGVMPRRVGEFIRYLVFKKTGSSMVLHSKRAHKAFAENVEGFDATQALRGFVAQNGVETVAREFNRYKRHWLILRHDSAECAAIINRAHRLAKTVNVPMVLGVLDRIADESVSLADVKRELSNVTLWKKVSIANSLRRRAVNNVDALYTVRTGRAYAKKREAGAAFMTALRQAKLDAVIDAIVAEIRPVVEGKSFLLSEEMDFAFPTSEKSFVGCIPMYSTLALPKSAVVGIHWVNVVDQEGRTERVDLDLHYTSSEHHVGWNTDWYDDDRRTILHSGDITDAPAPLGAAEAVYIPEGLNDFGALSLNCFTSNTIPVPYTLFVGNSDDGKLERNCVLAAQEAAVTINGLEISSPADFLGFVESDEEGKQIHFCRTGLGSSIVSSYNEQMAIALEAVKATVATRLSLRELLEKAGARFELGEDEEGWDFDLSLPALTKDSFAFLTK